MEFRRATPDDLHALADALSAAYSWPRSPCLDFPRMYPYLFSDARVGDHNLAVVGEQIVGVVGAYPYDIRLDGGVVRGAGIGQVATVPEWRHQGVMAKLLADTLQQVERDGVVLTWLSGDRHLYRRHGYSLGGVTAHYEFLAGKVEGDPPPEQVCRMTRDEILAELLGHRASLRNTLLIDETELAQVIAARDYGGHRLGEAWVVHDARGRHVYFGGGPVEQIELLLLYLFARAPIDARGRFTLSVAVSDEPTNLGRACLLHCHSSQRRPSCLWRVGELVPFLAAFCQICSARVGHGEQELGLVNTDNGQRATLVCGGGSITVREGADDAAALLDTHGLSALFFGSEPLDYVLPGVPLDSPFRRVLPIRAHHAWFVPV